jgi:hypothetical protein
MSVKSVVHLFLLQMDEFKEFGSLLEQLSNSPSTAVLSVDHSRKLKFATLLASTIANGETGLPFLDNASYLVPLLSQLELQTDRSGLAQSNFLR